MKKINRKGFTLIELLAVIIILGVLMIIAVPAVSNYISSSRNQAFITSIEKYIETAMDDVTGMEYKVSNPSYTYYIPIKCLKTENDDDSPYGSWESSYVVVTYANNKNEYYFTGRDSSNHGMLLTHRSLIDEKQIKTDLTAISNKVGVGTRTKIFIYSDNCDGTRTETTATTRIAEYGKA